MDIQNSDFKKWFIVFSAGMFFFYEYIQMTIFNTMPKQLIIAFHISAYSLAKLSASYFFMQIALLIPAGILLDRFSPKKIILIAMSISVLGTLLFSYAHSYQLAVISRLLSGVGGAFAFLSCIKIASQYIPHRLSLATGLLVTLAVLGGFIAQTPFAWITDETSWRISLRVLSSIGILILMNILLNMKINYEKNSYNKCVATVFEEIKITLKSFQTILNGIYISLMNLPVFLLGALWGGLYLQETHQLSPVLATFIASMLFVGIIIGSPFFAFLSEKVFFRKKPSMLLGAIMSLIVSAVLIATTSNNVFYLSGLFLLLGIVSSSQCLGYPLIVENNKVELAATATGIASVIIMGGGALIKIFYGRILDYYSSGNVTHGIPTYSQHAFHSAMMVFPVAFILAIAVIGFIREKTGAPSL